MPKLLQDLKSLRSSLILVPGMYYLMLIWSLLAADPENPRTVYYYNEMAFLPLLVLLTVLFFQRELGGSVMEIVATLPLSFAAMLIRKIALVLASAIILHIGWVAIYMQKFTKLETDLYSFPAKRLQWMEASWPQLLLQALPSYLLIIAFVVLLTVMTKKLYAGVAAGMTLWLLEVLSSGKALGRFVLLTKDIPKEIPFLQNRLLLAAAALILLLLAIWSANRRDRWIVHDDGE
ncbi:hypothetical protein [Paenibacillus eucommiae]|uniref:ABC transporter permease n=1 Tax=Paenibacillus eucommiae TaxID=1355755 RepID=A0ABS4J566_9BACL|nr:hypothetical protein [Paenibacillus eucommiae]MBP1994950.1 hypothetical protein [Paenibacillus eucommiae]